MKLEVKQGGLDISACLVLLVKMLMGQTTSSNDNKM